MPADVIERLGCGKRPPVTVTINGHTYRSTVASMAGRYLLPLSAENRTAANVLAGDEVDVTVELDTAPRVVEVPDDLAAGASPAARERWDRLSYSHQRRHVLAIDEAKTGPPGSAGSPRRSRCSTRTGDFRPEKPSHPSPRLNPNVVRAREPAC